MKNSVLTLTVLLTGLFITSALRADTIYTSQSAFNAVTGLGKLDHMRVSLWGLIMFIVGWCCVVHLRRREAVGRVETEMVRSSLPQSWRGSDSPAYCVA